MNEWQEWKRQQEAKLQARFKPPEPDQPKAPLVKRSITEAELDKLKKLLCVHTAWWCGDSRFIEQFAKATLDTQITERQAWFIQVLWYKYRRQLGHDGPRPEGYR